MLSTTFIVISIAVFVFAALEIFLSETQKKLLEDRTIRLWNWLDEAKNRSFLDLLRRRDKWIFGGSLTLAAIFVLWSVHNAKQEILGADGDLEAGSIGTLFLVGIFIWAGLQMVKFTLKASSLFRASIRATLFVLISVTPLLLVGTLMFHFKEVLIPSGDATVPQMLTVIALVLSYFFYNDASHFLGNCRYTSRVFLHPIDDLFRF